MLDLPGLEIPGMDFVGIVICSPVIEAYHEVFFM